MTHLTAKQVIALTTLLADTKREAYEQTEMVATLGAEIVELRRERDELLAENAKMAKQLVRVTEGNQRFGKLVAKLEGKGKGRR